MAEFTVGPFVATVVHGTTGVVVNPTSALYFPDLAGAVLDDTPHAGSTLNVGGYGFNIPLDATIIGVLVEIQAKASYNPSTLYVQIGSGGAYGAYAKTATLTTSYAVHQFGGLTDPWIGQGGPFTPAYLNSINIIMGQAGYNNVDITIDAVRVTIRYSTPPQTINLLPVTLKLGSLAQSLTKADPGDPTTYQNEVRPGEVVSRERVKMITLGINEPPGATKGNLWIDTNYSPAPIRVWAGTRWDLMVQPDSFVLGGFRSVRKSKAADWETIRAFPASMAGTWGLSWLVIGLNDGNVARIRLNQDDALVWNFTGQATFGYFESRNVYGAGRLATNAADQYVNDSTLVMPATITLVEFQMKRVSPTVDGQVTALTVWAHPR